MTRTTVQVKDPRLVVPSKVWEERAACRYRSRYTAHLDATGDYDAQLDFVALLCNGCPVRDACLYDALIDPVPVHQSSGVRGGCLEDEINVRVFALWKRTRPASCIKCGTRFVASSAKKLYCSKECASTMAEHRRTPDNDTTLVKVMEWHICEWPDCAKKFERISRSGKGQTKDPAKFCSASCRGKYGTSIQNRDAVRPRGSRRRTSVGA